MVQLIPAKCTNPVYLIDSQADLASIPDVNDYSIAYVPNAEAYIFDYDKWTVFEDFTPDMIFPLAFEPMDPTATFGDNAAIIAKIEPASGDDEDDDDDDGGDEK